MSNSKWCPNYCGWSSANPPVSSELSSSESITSSSELSSSATFTTCSCPTEGRGCTDCDYTLFKNKKEIKRSEIEYIKCKKKLWKKRNPFEMSSKTLKKLESKKTNKKLLEDTFSDSSDNSDCNCYHSRCNCNQYSSKNKQKNLKNKQEESGRRKCEKKISSKRSGKCTKTATTSEPLKGAKKKTSATKSSGKEKTSVFNPCNSRGQNCATKCAGSSKCSRVSKKFTKSVKSNNKGSCKCTTGSSERYSSSFSSEGSEDESFSFTSDDSEYESFSDDEDARDYCCGNVRQSCRKTKR
ncbi:uncharacterized protein LOC126856547 [Cataglyphis hispanica]|uniref:uncharacterized protein LOC126856547 n=1 Tax=Cataglyphis hispanica TaxID=1086592 RepID=UPI00217F4F73|nr:uncharacterized protein LOC126856547 [Cataglyphis hispanica]